MSDGWERGLRVTKIARAQAGAVDDAFECASLEPTTKLRRAQAAQSKLEQRALGEGMGEMQHA
jgi:hypothetical protein